MINLSIITVTYNSESSIKKYLETLIKNLPEESEVILIDNASNDNTVENIRSFNDKRLKFFPNSKNLGFSKANNLGVRKSQGKYLLFLNPDIEVVDNALKKLLQTKLDYPDAFLLIPKLISKEGRVQANVRKLPTLKAAFNEYFKGKENSYQEYVPETEKPVEVECAYGAAMLIENEVFNQIGGFDERYFLYYEDIDLCRKIGKLQKKILYIPNVVFKHIVGGSTSRKSSNMRGFLKVVSFFIPLEKDTRDYYQVQARNIYHGFFISFLITLIIFISQKVKDV